MKQKMIYLLQEGLLNHLNGNKGKYVAGASLAGIGAYAANNGNLGSAVNSSINNAAVLTGVGTSNLRGVDYGAGARTAMDSVKAAYNAETDPNIALVPRAAYDVGHGLGNTVQSINDTVDTVKGYFGESTDLDEINSDDEDESGLTTAAKTLAVSATTIAGGLHLAKNGEKYVDKTTKAAKAAKDKAVKATRNSASKLLIDVAKKVRAKKGK